MIHGDRLIAVGRVENMTSKERDSAVDRMESITSKTEFDANKSIKVGLNKLVGKKVFDVPKKGDFCSTVVDKALNDKVKIKGDATPADLLKAKNVKIIGVYDPLRKK